MSGIDSYTKLLLHCDGADASTTFPDASASNHTMTAAGNAQVDTAQSKFGGASALFDGTADYVTADDHADFEFGTGDFTIDTWVRFTTVPTAYTQFINKWVANQHSFDWVFSNATTMTFYCSTTSTGADDHGLAAGITFQTNTWYHVAVTRASGVLHLWVNGNHASSDPCTHNHYNGTAVLSLGGGTDSGSGIIGWMDEIRVSKGVARWTANFTPPILEYSTGLGQGTNGYLEV